MVLAAEPVEVEEEPFRIPPDLNFFIFYNFVYYPVIFGSMKHREFLSLVFQSKILYMGLIYLKEFKNSIWTPNNLLVFLNGPFLTPLTNKSCLY